MHFFNFFIELLDALMFHKVQFMVHLNTTLLKR